MAERTLIVLNYVSKAPAFAMCACCHTKFFTPQELIRDPVEAERNLQIKFFLHECGTASRAEKMV